MKHLLKIADLSKQEFTDLLNLADQLKYELRHGIPHPLLQGKSLGMIFQKASTRTRVSFEVGMYQLGGQALFLSNRDLQIGRGEPVQDTARVMGRYLDGIMIRTFDQSEVEALAEMSGIPVINGLTDYCHPCQILADFMTIREIKKDLQGLKLCYIGDGNNMCNSYIIGAMLMDMKIAVACPEGYEPSPEVLAMAEQKNAQCPGSFCLVRDPKEAAVDADVLMTDVWASMGQEEEAKERQKVFGGIYQINQELCALAKPDVTVLHCLPAHREEEITNEVFEAHADEIFEEAENRLHAQKAVMVTLMKDFQREYKEF